MITLSTFRPHRKADKKWRAVCRGEPRVIEFETIREASDFYVWIRAVAAMPSILASASQSPSR